MKSPKLPSLPTEWNANASRDLMSFAQKVYLLLERGLTVGDNAAGRSASVSWNSDKAPVVVPWPRAVPPQAVVALACRLDEDPGGAVVSLPAVTWSPMSGSVKILSIDGLTASADYTVDLFLTERS